jgi:hypothetical protein
MGLAGARPEVGFVTLNPVPAMTINSTTGKFGSAVAGGGDLNGDGFADLVVGAPLAPAFADPMSGTWITIGGRTDNFQYMEDLATFYAKHRECECPFVLPIPASSRIPSSNMPLLSGYIRVVDESGLKVDGTYRYHYKKPSGKVLATGTEGGAIMFPEGGGCGTSMEDLARIYLAQPERECPFVLPSLPNAENPTVEPVNRRIPIPSPPYFTPEQPKWTRNGTSWEITIKGHAMTFERGKAGEYILGMTPPGDLSFRVAGNDPAQAFAEMRKHVESQFAPGPLIAEQIEIVSQAAKAWGV